MTRTMLKLAATAGLLALTAGCTPLAPRWDAHFGEAVEQAKAQQTLNPDAARQHDTANGMDGKTARQVMESYRDDYRTAKPLNSELNIGTPSGAPQ